MDQNGNQTPTWKIILLSLLAIFSIARLIHRCSDYNRNDESLYRQNIGNEVKDYNQMYQKQAEAQKFTLDYPYYHVFEKRAKESLQTEKWVKVSQDSLIRFDLSAKLKISENWYFQKPIDEKVRYVLLTPEDIQITVYQFSTKKNLLTNLYYLRPDNFKLNGEADYKKDTNEAVYSFSFRDIPYKGVSIGVKEQDILIIFAFESRDYSFKKLEKFAGRFLVNHLVMD